MKKILILLAFSIPAFAQLTIPGADGSAGVMHFTVNTEIDLSQAVAGTWNAPGTTNGVYDGTQWAVVFKPSSLTIDPGVTVTFKNHPSRAPVVFLVSGDVTIAGTMDLNGRYSGVLTPAEPGPGGFRGAFGASGSLPRGNGMGPGATLGGDGSANHADTTRPFLYGSKTLIPLVGGSGGGEVFSRRSSGGGAVLIVAQNITIDGTISANSTAGGATGSGGAIRLVSDRLYGSGFLSAVSLGGEGRLRIQANSYIASLRATPDVIAELPGNPVKLWPDASLDASTRILSVGGGSLPSDPRARMDLPGADSQVATTNSVNVVIETRNLPTNSSVFLRVVPRHSLSFEVPATYTSGTQAIATWNVAAILPKGYNVLIVRAKSP